MTGFLCFAIGSGLIIMAPTWAIFSRLFGRGERPNQCGGHCCIGKPGNDHW